jgi:hypothetical protein
MPDEIVLGVVTLKGLHDLIDSAGKQWPGVARGKLHGLAVEVGMTVYEGIVDKRASNKSSRG